MEKEKIKALKEELKRQWKKVCKPYNVFDAWNMSENDHTKFLLALLRYEDHGSYPLLWQFLNRFTKGRGTGRGNRIYHQKPSELIIKFNPRYKQDKASDSFIDGLITFKASERHAVIIENKIYDAIDQPDQIRRYIKHMTKDEEIPLENVWVFYITGNGMKEIDPQSYNINDEKETTNIGRRFVTLNYEKDIVAWLKECILDARTYPEPLTSVVRTYVDFLEKDLFGEDDSQAMLKDKLCDKLLGHHNWKRLDEKGLEKLYDFIDSVQIKDNNVENDDDLLYLYRLAQEVIRDVEEQAFGEFEKVSAVILNKQWAKKLKNNGTSWTVAHRGTKGGKPGYLQIRCVDDWGSAHVEWCNLGTKDMLFGKSYQIELHVELGKQNKQLAEQWLAELKNKPIMQQEGVQRPRRNTKIVFRINLTTNKSLAKMTSKELEIFLRELYTEKLDSLFSLLLEHRGQYV